MPARWLHRPSGMLPTLHFHLAPWHVEVSLYAVALAAAVVAGLAVAVRRAAQPDAVLVAAPLAVVAGVGSSVVWHTAAHGTPGLSSMGGIAGGIATVTAVARVVGVPALVLLDALAPAALVGFAVGRVGCLLAGCCYGVPTALPWGLVIPAAGPAARHPVQLIEAAADLALAWWCVARRGPSGAVTGRAMVGYALARMVLEPLRDPASSDVAALVGIPLVHACAVLLLCGGLGLAATSHFRLDRTERAVGS